jgi:hypothetical protein
MDRIHLEQNRVEYWEPVNTVVSYQLHCSWRIINHLATVSCSMELVQNIMWPACSQTV